MKRGPDRSGGVRVKAELLGWLLAAVAAMVVPAPTARADVVKRNVFIFGVQMGGAETTASVFGEFWPEEKPGTMDLIRRNLAWSNGTAASIGQNVAPIAALQADAADNATARKTCGRIAGINARMLKLFEVYKASLAPVGQQAPPLFVLGIHLSGAEAVASFSVDSSREERPGSAQLIIRNLTWARREAEELNMGLATKPVDDLLEAVRKGASFREIVKAIEAIRLLWQRQLEEQPPFATAAAPAMFSDSFNRPDAPWSKLGLPDLAFGGQPGQSYVPIFGGPQSPVGVSLTSGALQNNGTGFGGVQFSGALPQDLNISVDLLVPTDAAGHATLAGPFFRNRAVNPGDGIFGGESAGYWVQLSSTGEVKVRRLNPAALVAASARPASFNSSAMHKLEIAVQGTGLQVALDGKLVTFSQDGRTVTTVAVPPTWDGPPKTGLNQGRAGVAFGAEDGRGPIGGQRADNLIVTAYRSLGGTPPGGPGGGGGKDPGARGDISFTLTWRHSGSSRPKGPDIDIWVEDPKKQRLSTSGDGRGLGPTPEGGRIDIDDRGGWASGNKGNGGGPERVFWPQGGAPKGRYSFGVRYYQGDGTAAYTVRVYTGTNLVLTKEGVLNKKGEKVPLGAVDLK
jgi:hypothetical protein